VIFIDTGAFLGRFIKKDQYHRKAISAWNQLAQESHPCFTSNFVLDESFTLLARRACYSFASERARVIYSSEVLKILRPEEGDELVALDLFEKFADQQVSFTDCISFVLMQKNGISRAFSFDKHFLYAGFRLWP
jgi:predicted nucleic acid-binding protein